jgi:hypothetical protein
MPSGTDTVAVPGTWSIIRKYYYYDGQAWYFKIFTFPAISPEQRVELHFGATFYKSRVWLNGTELGGHEGGYSSYFFDITPYLKPHNYLTVEIDNRPGVETIPGWCLRDSPKPGVWYDWWPQGGIIREVWLRLSAAQLVRGEQIRSAVSGDVATITDRVRVENHSPRAKSATLMLKVFAPDGGLADSSSQALSLAPGGEVVTVKLRLQVVKLWSFDNPQLYRMEAMLSDARGNVLDSCEDNFGVRTVEIRDRQLYLNGEAVRLTGIDRHEDSPWEGVAESAGTILHDFDDLKKLQVTLTRPVHYPQNPKIYDYCDRHGILLMPELPLWHFSASQLADQKVMVLAQQMMREEIEQDGNHPSIFAWSLCNESETNTPEGVAYAKTMYSFVKSLDPDRYVSYADDLLPLVKDPRENAASYVDFVMWNEYYGSGHGPIDVLPGLLEKIGKDYPDKLVIISEAAPWSGLTPDRKQAEEFRNASIGEELALFGKNPWIAGVLYWAYSPYRSHAYVSRTQLTVPVPVSARVYEGGGGFADRDRQREPIYDAFQKANSPANIELQLNWPEGETSVSPPAGFTASIARRGADQIPSYPLDHYEAVWQAVDGEGAEVGAGQETLPEIGAPYRLERSWHPPAKTRGFTLHLWLYRPTGFLAAEGTCWWRPPIWRLGIWRCSSGQ